VQIYVLGVLDCIVGYLRWCYETPRRSISSAHTGMNQERSLYHISASYICGYGSLHAHAISCTIIFVESFERSYSDMSFK